MATVWNRREVLACHESSLLANPSVAYPKRQDLMRHARLASRHYQLPAIRSIGYSTEPPDIIRNLSAMCMIVDKPRKHSNNVNMLLFTGLLQRFGPYRGLHWRSQRHNKSNETVH